MKNISQLNQEINKISSLHNLLIEQENSCRKWTRQRRNNCFHSCNWSDDTN